MIGNERMPVVERARRELARHLGELVLRHGLSWEEFGVVTMEDDPNRLVWQVEESMRKERQVNGL